ncbi:hypothetical protein [uncultured Photobacterium sp.]|uniref:hypothetical protein n=1 Tax=uncultured Photobacterium sp. TaxID=173973 RepID=UPI00260F78FE|nr:hypothetical protein [uncultured Photobacterium sp.]
MGIKLSRRGWNNVIIIAVILFIALVQFPDLIRERLKPESTPVSPSASQSLLPEQAVITRLYLPGHTLIQQGSLWIAEPATEKSPQIIVENWQSIAGTVVDEAMMTQLKPQLGTPRTVEIWLQSVEEPVRVTVYQLPQFWLLKGWQGVWLAISVDESYLFPL